MTKEEYDKQTSQAVEIIKLLNGIVGTQFNSAEFDQRFDDTDNLIHALEIFQLHISDTIANLKEIGKIRKDEKEYWDFQEKCKKGECETVSWADIPQLAVNEITDRIRSMSFVPIGDVVTKEKYCELLGRAVSSFKSKYNIKSIKI